MNTYNVGSNSNQPERTAYVPYEQTYCTARRAVWVLEIVPVDTSQPFQVQLEAQAWATCVNGEYPNQRQILELVQEAKTFYQFRHYIFATYIDPNAAIIPFIVNPTGELVPRDPLMMVTSELPNRVAGMLLEYKGKTSTSKIHVNRLLRDHDFTEFMESILGPDDFPFEEVVAKRVGGVLAQWRNNTETKRGYRPWERPVGFVWDRDLRGPLDNQFECYIYGVLGSVKMTKRAMSKYVREQTDAIIQREVEFKEFMAEPDSTYYPGYP